MGDPLLRGGVGEASYAAGEPSGELPEPDSLRGVGLLAVVCPCCCHPAHRGRTTFVSCAGCFCWIAVLSAVGLGLWYVLTFVVIQGEVCRQMESETHPDQDWLDHTAKMGPSNWEFAGSQAEFCKAYREAIRVEDWRVPASEFKEVFFNSTDGLRLQGFFLTAQNGNRTGVGPADQAPTIIQVHGHGPYVGQQSQMIPARAMQQQGFNVFVFNNQGLGKSEPPGGGYAKRAFGADEITNTEGAILEVTENPNGALPFATPLGRVGFYTESGGNGMVPFLRQDIPGIVMHGSVYDWFAQFRFIAQGLGVLGLIPMMDRVMMNCASATAQRGGIIMENYKDQVNRDVYDPTGRKVLLVHNLADEYNPFEIHALQWKAALTARGFDVTTYFPDESAEEGCNSHITMFWGLDRKKHFRKLCTFWEGVFSVQADCDSVLAFDTML